MILIFVGAGGAAAVDPEQYPTTARFFETLPETIRQNTLFQRVTAFIEKTKKDGELIDIEEVLWRLKEIQEYYRTPKNPETPVGWIMEQEFFRGFFGASNTADAFLAGFSRVAEEGVTPLIDEINLQVYDLYATPPSDSGQVAAWVQLFTGLAQIDPIVEIFTTNYDRILEYVIDEANVAVETGQRPHLDQRQIDWTLWNPFGLDYSTGPGFLTKLHGAVNWHRENERIIVGPCKFNGDHNDHVILYPGAKGKPQEEPFQRFHEYLQVAVQQAKAALFIGFSFRDDYINTILADLPLETPTCFITKKETRAARRVLPPPRAPSTNIHHHFQEGLTEETVSDCLTVLSNTVK